jgi:hypothetical protein
MVTFADPRAAPRLARLLRHAEVSGIRWFREPGAWIERPRSVPRVEPATEPILPLNRIRWTLNG